MERVQPHPVTKHLSHLSALQLKHQLLLPQVTKVVALAQGQCSSLLASPPFQQFLQSQISAKGKRSPDQFSHRNLERREIRKGEKFWEGRGPQLKPVPAHDYPLAAVSCAVTF